MEINNHRALMQICILRVSGLVCALVMLLGCSTKTTTKFGTTGSPAMGSKLILSGQRPGENVGGVVLERLKFVRYQYNAALRDGYTGPAYMVLRIKILPDGQVSDIVVDSASFDFASLTEGVLAEVNGWDFGVGTVPDDTTWIRLPLKMSQP